MVDIACGLQEAGLREFASRCNALPMSEWAAMGLYDANSVEGWGQAFVQAVTRTLDAGGRIHFDLTGLEACEIL